MGWTQYVGCVLHNQEVPLTQLMTRSGVMWLQPRSLDLSQDPDSGL